MPALLRARARLVRVGCDADCFLLLLVRACAPQIAKRKTSAARIEVMLAPRAALGLASPSHLPLPQPW